MTSNAFIAFQTNDVTRSIVEAIVEDNPAAIVVEQPAMVKIDVPDRLVIRRDSADLGALHIHFPRAGYVAVRARPL